MKNLLITSLLAFIIAVKVDATPGQWLVGKTADGICYGISLTSNPGNLCGYIPPKKEILYDTKKFRPVPSSNPGVKIRFYSSDPDSPMVVPIELDPDLLTSEMFSNSVGIDHLRGIAAENAERLRKIRELERTSAIANTLERPVKAPGTVTGTPTTTTNVMNIRGITVPENEVRETIVSDFGDPTNEPNTGNTGALSKTRIPGLFQRKRVVKGGRGSSAELDEKDKNILTDKELSVGGFALSN